MGTYSRKQREIEKREELILEAGRNMLLEKGYLGLNMERIAEEIEYSKGTIYKHFCCKEDLVGRLMIETLMKIREIILKAVGIGGTARERMTAIGLVLGPFMILNPGHLRTYELMRIGSLREKVSSEKLEIIHDLHHELISIMEKILDEALENGELVLSCPEQKENIIAAGWSMAIGAYMVFSDVDDRHVFPGIDFKNLFPDALQVMMDGLAWVPLSSERDYKGIVEARLREQGFL